MQRVTITLIFMALLAAACASGAVEEDLPSPSQEAPDQVQAVQNEPTQPSAEPALTAVPTASETDTPQPATETPAITQQEQAERSVLPSVTPQPAPTQDPAALVISGQTEEGAFFLGNPDAPVTVIDYSDFL